MTEKESLPDGSSPSPRRRPRSRRNEQLTEGEILRRGEEAANLLNAPIYNVAHAMALEEIQEQWLSASDPQERENLWQQAQNLGLVAEKLAAILNEAQSLNLEEEEQAALDLSRYLDEQGFGFGPDNPLN